MSRRPPYTPGKPHDQYDAKGPPVAPYSYSQLSLLDTVRDGCPRRYWLRYIAKAATAPPSKALALGSFFHDEVMEPALAGGLSALAGASSRIAALAAKAPSEIAADVAQAAANAAAWVDRCAPSWREANASLIPEQGIYLHRDGTASAWSGDRDEVAPPGVLLRGKLDLTILTTEIAIVDYKSGSRPYRVEDPNPDKGIAPQLRVYRDSAAAFWRTPVAKATFFNAKLTDKPEAFVSPEPGSGLAWASHLAADAERRDWRRIESWEPRESSGCFFCDWKASCPAKMQKSAASSAAVAEGVEDLRGILQEVVYTKPESEWRILRFALVGGDGSEAGGDDEGDESASPSPTPIREAKVLGTVSTILVGAEYALRGIWQDAKPGPWTKPGEREFNCGRKGGLIRPIAPKTPEACERVLTALPGFGPVRASRAVTAFGTDIFDAINSVPQEVANACGMPVDAVHRAGEKLGASLQEIEVKAELASMIPAIHTRVLNAIWKALGPTAIDAIRANPYVLSEYPGIGWDTADGVAGQLGIYGNDPRRVQAGVIHVLRSAENDGHTALSGPTFAERAEGTLHVDIADIRKATRLLVEDGEILVQPDKTVQLAEHARREEAIVDRLWTLHRQAFRDSSSYDESKVSHLTDEQAAFVRGVTEHGVAVLTGGPGTGKTTSLRALLDCLPRTKRVALAAPTGKAARQMAEATGLMARTVHSLLAPDFSDTDPEAGRWAFAHGPDNLLPYEVVVIDESSMLDHELLLALLDACAPGTWVVLIGDADQLPSVGPGEALRAIVENGPWPVYRLDKVHRNAGVGRLACASIIRGVAPDWGVMSPETPADPLGNNAWLLAPHRGEAAVQLVLRLIDWAKAKGFDPMTDVAVLSANSKMHGDVSAPALNARLQAALNPAGAEMGKAWVDPVATVDAEPEGPKLPWRVGDRLMITKNDRSLGLVNGDLATIVGVTDDGKEATLAVDGREAPVSVGRSEIDARLGYAGTVHKWQGSQAPVVIIALDYTAQRAVVSRQWLYTAVSRFRSYCFVVAAGSRDVERVVGTVADGRCTGLPRLLVNAAKPQGVGR